jgi:carbon monoxide dehydrogenase subunit G
MLKFEKSIEIDAPVETVFAYTVDPARTAEFMSGGEEITNVQRLPDGRYTYTVVSKVLTMRVEVKVEQTEVVPNERIVERLQGPGMDATVTERLETLADGNTRVSFVSEGNLHGGPLAKFGEGFLGKFLDRGTTAGLEAVKAHIEASAPTDATR